MTLETVKLHLLGRLMQILGFTWKGLGTFLETHTFVHPTYAPQLSDGSKVTDLLLAQGFVETDRLVEWIRKVRDPDRLLAVDGLSGPNVPNFELENYLPTLQWADEEEEYNNPFRDEEFECRKHHAAIVRDWYEHLKDVPDAAKHVYCMLREIYRDLPELEGFESNLDSEVKEKCLDTYRSSVQEQMRRVLKNQH